MIESLDSTDQPLDTPQDEGDENLSPEQLEARMALRLQQMVHELKRKLALNHKAIYDAQQLYAENQGTEEEIVELQGKDFALKEALLSTMGQYSDMMQQRIALAGIIPMWADVEPGRLINVAA